MHADVLDDFPERNAADLRLVAHALSGAVDGAVGLHKPGLGAVLVDQFLQRKLAAVVDFAADGDDPVVKLLLGGLGFLGHPGLGVGLDGLEEHLLMRGNLGLVPGQRRVHLFRRNARDAAQNIILHIVPALVLNGAVFQPVNVVAGFAAAAHGLEFAVALMQGMNRFAHVVVIEAVAAEAVLQALLRVIAHVDDAVVAFHHLQGILDRVARRAAAVVRVEEIVVPGRDGLALHIPCLRVQSGGVVGGLLNPHTVFHHLDPRSILFVYLCVFVPGGSLPDIGLTRLVRRIGDRAEQEDQHEHKGQNSCRLFHDTLLFIRPAAPGRIGLSASGEAVRFLALGVAGIVIGMFSLF